MGQFFALVNELIEEKGSETNNKERDKNAFFFGLFLKYKNHKKKVSNFVWP